MHQYYPIKKLMVDDWTTPNAKPVLLIWPLFPPIIHYFFPPFYDFMKTDLI